jgi:hypothetical protein
VKFVSKFLRFFAAEKFRVVRVVRVVRGLFVLRAFAALR